MKNTVVTFKQAKEKGEKLTMLTAYDYTTAKLVNEAGIHSILVRLFQQFSGRLFSFALYLEPAKGMNGLRCQPKMRTNRYRCPHDCF